MEYNFSEDLKSIREILGFSQSELAEKIGVEQVTISRTELKKTEPSARLLEAVYSFAFDKNIKINKLKEKVMSRQYHLFQGLVILPYIISDLMTEI